jgi:hypothetical protein
LIQSEIDEISEAFMDAWEEYFGQIMYYVPFNDNPSDKHSIYGESKKKTYDFTKKVMFHGTFKQEPIEEKGELGGGEEREVAEITLVTKELYDKGVKEFRLKDIIEITDRDGVTKNYNIYQNYGKVQLGNNRVFTKLKVVDIDGE